MPQERQVRSERRDDAILDHAVDRVNQPVGVLDRVRPRVRRRDVDERKVHIGDLVRHQVSVP